jgi:hypothetical protein
MKLSYEFWYFIAGIAYVLINGFIRRLYSSDDNMLLVIAQILFWPIFFIGLIALNIEKFLNKINNGNNKKRIH